MSKGGTLLFIKRNEKEMTKYTIEVDDETWKNFKETVSKNETLNDVIGELIKGQIQKER